MQGIFRTLILGACALLFSQDVVLGQVVVCPGKPVIFQLDDDYYGTKTWEYSPDGVMWTTVEVTENEALSLQPEQLGWYRVRFLDADCDTSYVSDAVRFAVPAIDLGATMSMSIGGRVTDEWGFALWGATVRAGCGAGVRTTTDGFGVFLLEGVGVFEQLAKVTVEKEGYLNGSRSFVPGDNAAGTVSYVSITLLPKILAGTVNGAAGGAVALEGVTITFPANAFVRDGQPYTGAVNIALNHIDPTSEDLERQMPGMLMGVLDEQPQLLLSYGMIGAELTDNTGSTVQLAPGSPATVRFPVMPDQQADAPQVIPLWWFDEDLGYWVQEGEAQRVGNEYVGQVAHFSWWKIDVPANFVLLKGPVIDQTYGTFLANARVVLLSQTMGSGTTYTNGMGEFSGLVPIGETLTLQVWLPCGPLGTYVLVYEEEVGPFQADSGISIVVAVPTQSLVMGNVLDCASVPVEQGYVWVNGQAVFCTAGAYQFITCADSVTLRGVDLLTDSVSDILLLEVTADTTLVEDLTTCIPLYGTVSDIDGNSYQTVLIGSQEWMAENLKTTRYRDGSTIPNVTDGTAWSQLTTGAWCNYDNSAANDATYGKLYNWYAAANPNMCPQGWHVHTDAEWTTLTDHLGGVPVAGGKMKATTLWNVPNTGATNESGFSGLPGGFRDYHYGDFLNLGNYGLWWSASENGEEYAWYRYLNYGSAGVDRVNSNKKVGFCLRCVRD